MDKYVLRCTLCNRIVPDRFTSRCGTGHDALIRTGYRKKRLDLNSSEGMFRFSDWLPVQGKISTRSGPVTYPSEGLARELGLSRLYIGFSGYCPERNAWITTCSFKELEAFPTMLRLQEQGGGVLVLASAGNTARAFAQVSAITGIPAILVVPESSLHRLWTTVPANNLYIVTVKGDYTDAITISREIAPGEKIVPEGGAKNVARRDGMGTVMLDAAFTIGRMPDHYFQAVGSGTGGIAAWEASLRLRTDGRFGSILPRLHLSQNLPFTPMVSAFREGRREIIPDLDMPDAKSRISQVSADVLTNRNPPYGICGGTYDALKDTRGTMYAVTNSEAYSAGKLFEDLEGIDPDPAAAVAVASLMQAAGQGIISPRDTILLNITGGGYARIREDPAHRIFPLTVCASVPAGSCPDALEPDLTDWVKNHA
ncbi:MAG: cysteate synthase [Methanoregulaceae archaeon]